jgi:hypothetical protein
MWIGVDYCAARQTLNSELIMFATKYQVPLRPTGEKNDRQKREDIQFNPVWVSLYATMMLT